MQADLNITPGAGPETDAATTAVEDAERLTPKLRTDHHVWGIYIALLIISVIELFSASSQEVSPDDIYGPIIRHARFLGIGLLLMLFIQKFHYVYILKAVPWYLAGSIGAMMLVLVAGVKINGTMRGLQVGPLTVLPAEFLKLGAALGVAWILSRNQMPGKRDVTTKGVVYCTLLILFCCGLLLEQGLTNTLLLMAISLSMMLIGGVSMKKFGAVLLVYGVLAGGYFAVRQFTKEEGPSQAAIEVARLNQEEVGESEAIKRMGTWKARFSRHFRLSKYDDEITDENKQEQLSYIAQAHGGLFGVGPATRARTPDCRSLSLTISMPLSSRSWAFSPASSSLSAISGCWREPAGWRHSVNRHSPVCSSSAVRYTLSIRLCSTWLSSPASSPSPASPCR